MARRTKEDALATRERILDTAELVFQRRGVSRTSLQEIALEAGLTRGAIYWHFENKGELFHAMMQRVTLPMVAQLNSGLAVDLDNPLDHIRKNIGKAYRQTVHDVQVRRVFEIASQKVEYVEELSGLRDNHITDREACMDDLHRVFVLAKDRGLIRNNVDTTTAVVGLHALIDGLMHNWLLQPEAFDLELVGAATLDHYLAGLQ